MKRSPSSSCSSNNSSSSSSFLSNTNEPEIIELKPETKKPKLAKKRAKKDTNNGKELNAKNQNSAKRSSIYRGVTRHRWTGRFEAHLWDKSCWNNVQNKKGRQVYLGAYDSEEAAARTYDLAALKYWGPTTILNFTIDSYTKEMEEMEKVTREEYLASLRRQSSGFSRGVSKYRGVARHHHNGRWEARIGRVFGNKYLYLGTYKTQEEAAAAYDMAAIEYRGANAVTNFDISNYLDRLENNNKININNNDDNDNDNDNKDNIVAIEEPKVPMRAPPSPSQSNHHHHQYHNHHHHNHHNHQHQLQHQHCLLSCGGLDEPSSLVNDLVVSWGYLDAGFAPLPVPADLPLEKPGELLDLFDDAGFEDDIDLIFGSPDSDGTIDLFDATMGGGGIDGGAGSSSSSIDLRSPSISTNSNSVSTSCI